MKLLFLELAYQNYFFCGYLSHYFTISLNCLGTNVGKSVCVVLNPVVTVNFTAFGAKTFIFVSEPTIHCWLVTVAFGLKHSFFSRLYYH